MMARIDNETIRYLFHIQVQQGAADSEGAPQPSTPPSPTRPRADAVAASAAAARASEPQHLPAVAREIERRQQRQQKDLQYQTAPRRLKRRAGEGWRKSGRNDPCPAAPGKNTKCTAQTSRVEVVEAAFSAIYSEENEMPPVQHTANARTPADPWRKKSVAWPAAKAGWQDHRRRKSRASFVEAWP